MTCFDVTKDIYTIGNGYEMGAVAVEKGVQFTVFNCSDNSFELLIYNKKHELMHRINMLDYSINRKLCSVIVSDLIGLDFTYIYLVDGKEFTDPFTKKIISTRKYKEIKSKEDESALYFDDFDWQNDKKPGFDYSDIIAYQLHVRGFTAHTSSKVKNRGKFKGIIEKIPYLKDLGINQIVLMPAYEFYEYDVISANDVGAYMLPVMDNSVVPQNNFWGFKEGLYFVPKSNYATDDPIHEFKTLVREIHKNGIEIVMRFYFPETYNRLYISDVLRFWAKEYHVDGFFLMGKDIPIDIITADPYLCDCKIYNVFFDKASVINRSYYCNKNLAFSNKDYSVVLRKYLKGDENMINDFLYRTKFNPSDVHMLNYITDYEGFTLNDLLSYDYKHNENNGEDNRDGEDYNHSWNCGYEGYTRKKSIQNLRIRQIKNALAMLLLSQSTPMLLAGDECLNSQSGNNNAYCQDNEIGWVVWKENDSSKEIFNFTKYLIELRKTHPILHMNSELKVMDYISCGFPDISYHSEEAWSAKLENHIRHVGVMLCGKYAPVSDSKNDDFFYIAYNMHWEKHYFGLPNLPKGLKWKELFTTYSTKADTDKSLIKGNESYPVNERTITVFKSFESVESK